LLPADTVSGEQTATTVSGLGKPAGRERRRGCRPYAITVPGRKPLCVAPFASLALWADGQSVICCEDKRPAAGAEFFMEEEQCE
jgi:hypothetical protein